MAQFTVIMMCYRHQRGTWLFKRYMYGVQLANRRCEDFWSGDARVASWTDEGG